jgi:hypothetical protein
MSNIIGTIIGFVAIVVALSALLSLPVMWLWDWLMPELFGLKTITWAQAWGLMVLCGMLFKSHTSSSK